MKEQPKYLRKLHAPFLPNRVKAINQYQTCYLFIPIKCPECDKPYVAKRRGLVCPKCTWVQQWVYRYTTCLKSLTTEKGKPCK